MKIRFIILTLVVSFLNGATPTSNAPFLKPDEAIAKMKVMPGFEIKAFVAEPDIGEAIAFCFDFKGRLWTLENYNYQTRRAHSTDKRNRIQIFEVLTEGLPPLLLSSFSSSVFQNSNR